jgi:hypothetical protein
MKNRRKSNIDDFTFTINQINEILEEVFFLSIETSRTYKVTFFFDKEKNLIDLSYCFFEDSHEGMQRGLIKKRITYPLKITALRLNEKDVLEEGTKEIWFFYNAGVGQEIFLTIPKDSIEYNYCINPLRGIIQERL